MSLLIPALIFVTLLLLILGLFYYFQQRSKEKGVVQRLEQETEGISEQKEESDRQFDLKKSLLRMSDVIGRYIVPKSEEELSAFSRQALKAGIRRRNFATIMYGAKVACAIAFPAIALILRMFISRPIPVVTFMIIVVALAVLGFYTPNIWLRSRIDARKEQILHSFPDALDLLVICVEAGMSLDSAITRVGEELKLGHKALSEEFKLLSLELRAGKTRREALRNFGLRTDLDEVNSLVTLLIQTDRFGTSIAQALRVYSDTMRTSRFNKAEEMAMKLPVKLVVPMIIFIFPSLFVVILGPALIQVFRMWTKS